MVIWLNKFNCLISSLSEDKSSYDIYMRIYFVNLIAKILISIFMQTLVKTFFFFLEIQVTLIYFHSTFVRRQDGLSLRLVTLKAIALYEMHLSRFLF